MEYDVPDNMIISRQKELKDIIRIIKEDTIFIIGCGKCASKQHVGGEKEVLEIRKKLEESGKNITGWTIFNSACSILSWDEIMSLHPEIEKAKALLVMSCGGGVSVISKFANMQVYPALETQSLGGVCCNEIVEEQCAMCGDCTVYEFGGICPVICCRKSLLNGPCGGAIDGKCEVDDRDCAWDMIYERLKGLGKLENLENPEYVFAPKDHSIKIRRQA